MLRLIFCLLLAAISNGAAADTIFGQGDFRYRLIEGWAAEALQKVSVKNGHAMAIDKQGRILFLTDDPKNNLVILAADGTLIAHWTARMPGAHGMTLTEEDGKEVLYITDTVLHEVRKLTLTGEEIAQYPWPESSGLYTTAAEYKPSKVIMLPAGGFCVFDGYGKDYVHQYNAARERVRSWGGNLGDGENQLAHFGPHGGGMDLRDPGHPVLLVCMSDKLEVKRFTPEGQFIDKFPMPGGNPRDAVFFGEYLFIPHLSDNWPADKNAPGFVSVLDRHNRIISNIGASAPEYDATGALKPMKSLGAPFIHPHGIAVDGDGNLYVAQFASKAAPLLKFERLR